MARKLIKPKTYLPVRLFERIDRLDRTLGKDAYQEMTERLESDALISWLVNNEFGTRKYKGPYKEINRKVTWTRFLSKEYRRMGKEQALGALRQGIAVPANVRKWWTYKQVYRFDPDFAEELMETSCIDVPVETLSRLPFSCYYLDIEAWEEFSYAGIFVYLGFDPENGLPNLIFTCVGPTACDSEEISYLNETANIYFPYTYCLKTGILQKQDGRGYCYHLELDVSKWEENERDLIRLTLFALQSLLYLSSSEPDLTAYQKPERIQGTNGTVTCGITMTDVGVRYGALIRKAKKQAKVMVVNGKKTSRRVASHVRRAHWHHYWTGKGRTKLIVKWIPPVFVSGNGGELPITIRDVKE